MKKKSILRILLLVSGITAFTCTDAFNDTLLVKKDELGPGIHMSGSWRYHAGDDTAWASPLLDDAPWMRYEGPSFADNIKEWGVPDFKGKAWFRTTVIVDSSRAGIPLNIKLKHSSAIEVFIDGRSVLQEGTFSGTGSGAKYVYNMLYPQHLYIFNSAGKHTVAIRYEKDIHPSVFLRKTGSYGFEIQINRAADNFYDYSANTYALNVGIPVLAGVLISLAFIHFLLYLFRKRDRSNLLFALFCLFYCLTLVFNYYYYYSVSSISAEVLEWLYGFSIFLTVYYYHIFNISLYAPRKKYYRVSLILCAVFWLLNALSVIVGFFSYLILVYLSLVLLHVLFMIIKAVKSRMPSARFSIIGIMVTLVLFLFFLYIILIQRKFSFDSSQWSFLLYFIAWFFGMLSIPLSMSAYLAWSFSNTQKKLEQQMQTSEDLAKEKQAILENQKSELEEKVQLRTREIEVEKQRSDALLLNILPREIAEELKLKGGSKAQKYEEVSVLFTDFVNFTRISETLGVEELLEELNIHFTAFDQIMDRYGLEKIKTIGDAYLAVSGLPAGDPMHAQNAVKASLEITAFVKERMQQVPYGLDIRIGIHSGSLIAGIIGVKKFAYDVWGDTVNTAARMEQASQPGRVNISQATCRLVQNDFDCTYRGKIDVKGKGKLDMYFVEGIKHTGL